MPPQHTLFAISDIHLSHPQNLAYFSDLPSQKHLFPANSGLILAGDVGESIRHLRTALEISLQVFKYVWWVPGNHELYTIPKPAVSPVLDNGIASGKLVDEQVKKDAVIDSLKGEHRYLAFIDVCRSYPNVFTPSDEWVIWDPLAAENPVIHPSSTNFTSTSISQSAALICPLFTLYDYTFRPPHITSTAEALSWAAEADIVATDEALLHADPYTSKESWSETLISTFQARLLAARRSHPTLPFVLINHWPLHEAVLHIPRIPRFSIWCGSRRTQHWVRDLAPVKVVVTGHLHVRRTDWFLGARWEEVSLGYPSQWKGIREGGLRIADVLREILPGPEDEADAEAHAETETAGNGNSADVGGGEEQKQKTRWRILGGR